MQRQEFRVYNKVTSDLLHHHTFLPRVLMFACLLLRLICLCFLLPLLLQRLLFPTLLMTVSLISASRFPN